MAKAGMQEVKAEIPSAGQRVDFLLDFGESLSEAIAIFGEPVIFDRAIRGLRVEAQGSARNMLKAGKEPEEIKNFMETQWKPGMQTDGTTNLLAKINSLPEDERAKILAALNG